jgi:hypothetical protein
VYRDFAFPITPNRDQSRLRAGGFSLPSDFYPLEFGLQPLAFRLPPERRNGRRAGLKNPLWAISSRHASSLATRTKPLILLGF